ncbi:MAG TPA: hypothetical protein VJM15_07390 [Sphingomicrobium sp.]|nr:hypothetical protein [Sphingomicrobium sp.]
MSLAIVLAAVAAQAASAPADDRREVMAVVDRVFEAINTNDAEALRRISIPEGMNISLRYQPDGSTKLRTVSNSQDAANTAAEKRRFTEKYWNPTLLIHNGIAVFWAPYSFDIDGKRSHCGVDQFDFIKVDGEWKLASSMWTVEPDGCPKE